MLLPSRKVIALAYEETGRVVSSASDTVIEFPLDRGVYQLIPQGIEVRSPAARDVHIAVASSLDASRAGLFMVGRTAEHAPLDTVDARQPHPMRFATVNTSGPLGQGWNWHQLFRTDPSAPGLRVVLDWVSAAGTYDIYINLLVARFPIDRVTALAPSLVAEI